jgi:hypothetical protein
MYNLNLSGMEVVSAEKLIGSKKAVKSGNRLFVSPAVYSLLHDGSRTRKLVMQYCDVVDVGKDTPLNILNNNAG